MISSGSIVLVELGKAPFGHEQSGRRPGIVVSSTQGMVLVIPLTANQEALRFAATHRIKSAQQNNLSRDSIALIFQIRSLDARRVVDRIGNLGRADKNAINKILRSIALIH